MVSDPFTSDFRLLPINSDVTATGPTASCRELPTSAYVKHGMNAPYKPYTVGSPARLAYDIPMGEQIQNETESGIFKKAGFSAQG